MNDFFSFFPDGLKQYINKGQYSSENWMEIEYSILCDDVLGGVNHKDDSFGLYVYCL